MRGQEQEPTIITAEGKRITLLRRIGSGVRAVAAVYRQGLREYGENEVIRHTWIKPVVPEDKTVE